MRTGLGFGLDLVTVARPMYPTVWVVACRLTKESQRDGR